MIFRSTYIIIFLCTLTTYNLLGQEFMNNWYFGDGASLRFMNDVTFVTNNSSMETSGGCASISNENGELLFYSNGETIWNRNHEIMINGEGLVGDDRITNSVTIVPKPGVEEQYFVFTLGPDCIRGAGFGIPNGLQYNIVDMSLNDGQGEVILKNKKIFSGATSEKITAIPHGNGKDYWIATYFPPLHKIRVYLLSENGLEDDYTDYLIDQKLGKVCTTDKNGDPAAVGSIGYMKASPDGSNLALAGYLTGYLGIYNFNAFTGEVLNEKILHTGSNPYGVEFSPNSQLLYVSFAPETDTTVKIGVKQYDLQSDNELGILESETSLITNPMAANYPNAKFGAMQLTKNDEIYIASRGGSYLSVIKYPNNRGSSSSLAIHTISLGNAHSQWGLPMFFQRKIQPRFIWENVCAGEETNFQLLGSTFTNIEWDFGDGNSSTSETPTHIFPTPGEYEVTVTFKDYFEEEYQLSKQITIGAAPAPTDNFTFTRESFYPGIVVGRDTLLHLISSDPQSEAIRFYKTEQQALTNKEEITDPMTFHDGTYFARVINKYTDCFAIVPVHFEVTVLDEEEVESGCIPSIPSAFSPNSDHVNDVFTFMIPENYNCEISIESFIVFDRWGNEVYSSEEFMWDGKTTQHQKLQPGKYIYSLYYSSQNDYAELRHQQYTGTVYLLQ